MSRVHPDPAAPQWLVTTEYYTINGLTIALQKKVLSGW